MSGSRAKRSVEPGRVVGEREHEARRPERLLVRRPDDDASVGAAGGATRSASAVPLRHERSGTGRRRDDVLDHREP